MENTILSQRGKPKIIENGKSFSFEKNSKDGETQFWKCDMRGSCKARLHIRNGLVIRRINNHTHPGDATKIEVMEALTVLRDRAVNTLDQTAQVVAASLRNLSQAGQGALPAMYSLKRTVQRKRVAQVAGPVNPQTLDDLEIPEAFRGYAPEPEQFEQFLLYDSGRDSGRDRMLIFSTRRNLAILQRSTH